MNKLDKLIKKYRERQKDYEYTPVGEVLSDLVSLIPKKKNE